MRCTTFFLFWWKTPWEFLMTSAALNVQLDFGSTAIFNVLMQPVHGSVCMLPSSISFFSILITNIFWIYNCVVFFFGGGVLQMRFFSWFLSWHAWYWYIEKPLISEYWFYTLLLYQQQQILEILVETSDFFLKCRIISYTHRDNSFSSTPHCFHCLISLIKMLRAVLKKSEKSILFLILEEIFSFP